MCTLLLHVCLVLLVFFFDFFFNGNKYCCCTGLVEGRGERPAGFRACSLREEAGPQPIGQSQQPDGRVHHLCSTEPDRDAVSHFHLSLIPCSLGETVVTK